MDASYLSQLYQDLDALRASGREADAQQLLLERMRALPEDDQAELMLRIFNAKVEDRANELAAVREFQEEGLKTLTELDREER